MKICSVDGCDKTLIAKGYCKMHYTRMSRHGTLVPKIIKGDSEKSFHAKYIPILTGCWIWMSSLSDRGYGQLTIKNKTIYAHRFSWELHNGPIPEGLLVCHHCDTPLCVNPDHLFVGTQKDNILDAMRKGRLTSLDKRDSRGRWVKQHSKDGGFSRISRG